ncbi:COG1361 family protein [Halobaculum gomorrense]|uniref:NEW3 domain-containing protein n=1 Tax=Halobaculum gomorrense TaxID=43928 RepID=UPI00135634AF|nr:NEW3 domain-containing protein [Halobaculum gomorrense]
MAVVVAATTGAAATQSDEALGLSLNPVRDTVAPGETVQIGVTVENAGETVAPGTVLAFGSLPDGWRLASWSGTDAAFRNSTNEWFWTTVGPGETLKFTVVVAIPPDAAGEGTVTGTLSDGRDREASANTTISVRRADVKTTRGSQTTASASGSTANAADDSDGVDTRSRLGRLRTAVETPGFGPVQALAGVLLAVAALAARRRGG